MNTKYTKSQLISAIIATILLLAIGSLMAIMIMLVIDSWNKQTLPATATATQYPTNTPMATITPYVQDNVKELHQGLPKPETLLQSYIYKTFTIQLTNGDIDSILIDSNAFPDVGCDYAQLDNENGHTCGIVNASDIISFLDSVGIYYPVLLPGNIPA